MKRFLFLFIFCVISIFPQFVSADQGWNIDYFNSDITIMPTGKVHITETISTDFKTLEKHGIYRYIPYAYHDENKVSYLDIQIISVQRNGNSTTYTTKRTGENLEVKIGDANKTLSGNQDYTIIYDVIGALKSFGDHDELYWNVTGNNWETAISHASSTIFLPSPGLKQITCFEGLVGSKEKCASSNQTSTSTKFASSRGLSSGEGLTIVVGWSSGMVPILTAEKPKSFTDLLFTPFHILLFLFLALLSVGSIFWLWFTQGRDKWVKNPLILSLGQKITDKPLLTHDTTVVEFEPPSNLRPGEIGVLMDQRADTIDVTATIIDLASRGFITITEIPKKWLFGKTDYLMSKKEKDTKELLEYELLLLNRLFSGRKSTHISTLKTTFYDDLYQVKQALYKDLVAKDLFVADPETVRLQYLFYGIGLLVVGIAGTTFSAINEWALPTVLCASLIPGGIFLIIMARFMPRRTAEGYDLYRRIKGYELFISTSEKYRQRFFEKENMFNTILPYAIVFGLTGKFAESMKDMGIKTAPTWYIGHTPFTPIVFAKNIENFSSSLSQAIATSPKSSGFSSSGSSGGGFGGGGGGSW